MNCLELIDLVDRASAWSEARAILENHIELLNEACDALSKLIQQAPTPDDTKRLKAIQPYFERCRSFGVAHATAEQIAAVQCSMRLEDQPVLRAANRVMQSELTVEEALQELSTNGIGANESDLLLVVGHIRDILSGETLDQALLLASLANAVARQASAPTRIKIVLLLAELQHRKGAIEEAIVNLEQADHLSQITNDDLTRATIAGEIAECLLASGETKLAQECFERAVDLCLPQQPIRAWGYLAQLADTYEEARDFELAIATERRAIEVARQAGASQSQVYSLGDLGRLLMEVGQKEEAREVLRRAVERSRETDDASDEAWRCYLLAEALWPDNKDDAFFQYRAAVNLAPFEQDWRAASLYLATFGRHLRDEGRYDEAREVYEKAVAYSRKLNDQHEEASFRGQLADVLHHQNRLEEAREEYEAALALSIAEGDHVAQEGHLANIADIDFRLDRVQKAVEYATRALQLAEQIGDAKEPIYRLFELAKFCVAEGNLKQSQAYADQAIDRARRQDDKGLLVDALTSAGRFQASSGSMERALVLLQQALTISREDNDRLREIQVIQQISQMLNAIDLKDEAINLLRQGLQAAHAENQPLLQLQLIETLNLLDGMEGLWDEVELVGNAALAMCRQNGDRSSLTSCLDSLGNLYAGRDPQRAIGYYEELVRQYESWRQPQSLALALSGLGDAWEHFGDVGKALQCYERALNSLAPDQSAQIHAFLLINLANSYRRLSHYEESQRYFDMASRLLGQSTSASILSDIAYTILSWRGDLYFEQGKWKEAADAYRPAIELLNRLFQIAATASVRAHWIDSGRLHYTRLIQASLRTAADCCSVRDEGKRAAFEFAEAARSRLFIGQLGQTFLLTIPGLPREWIERESEALAGLKALEHENIESFAQRVGRYIQTWTASFIEKRLEHWNELQKIWTQVAASGDAGREYVALRKGETADWLDLARLLSEY